jgi:penicillin amidase
VADLPGPRLKRKEEFGMDGGAHPTPRHAVPAPGLDAGAEIILDRWGIPHIYAGTQHDAFFAQGWNIARERLWQLDLWRKRGLGRLSASFGAAYVAQDRAARLFLYRGDMDAEWAAYGPDARAWTSAFVAGINVRVDQVLSGAEPLPLEFQITDTRPERWATDDVVRIRSHGISNNAEGESLRARLTKAGGDPDVDRLRRGVQPWDHAVRVPEGLDPADIPDDLLAVYTLATKEVSFAATAAAPPQAEPSESDRAAMDASQGSNNWAIAAQRTTTGRPILASDPHRVLNAPSIRYVAHLDAPGLTVIGAGEPHLPGVTIGHNGACAFGITTFMIDQADHYVYELNPDNPDQYRYAGAWEPLRIVAETIPVRGGADETVELAFARHGPVLKHEPEKLRAFALRTVWTEPGTAAYFGAARYQTAADWPAFREALSHWGAAPMNFVYADTHGTIAWIPTGLAPRRPNWDGLLPVPGDGRYEWAGFAAPDELPAMVNPERGWVASANEFNLPPGHPSRHLNLGYEWADPGRADRIDEVLSRPEPTSLEDSMRLQTDIVSNTALRAVGLLAGLASPDPQVQLALELLAAWDGAETKDSAAAAIAECWMNKHLAQAVARRLTNEVAAKIVSLGSPYGATMFLTHAPPELAVARNAILLESLAAALAELASRLGPQMAAWRWGDLHHVRFAPPVAARADEATRARLEHPKTPLPGSAWTLWASTFRMDDFAAIQGASFRMVVDVGDWDASVVVNTPGQSGDPASPHYADLLSLWAAGQYVPMLWSREKIEAAAEAVFELSPG